MVWTPPVTAPDAYDVYARWGSGNSGASDANYTVTHAGGTDTVTVDQTTAYDGNWIKLGTYDLAPNAGHKVTLSGRANGQVAADAIRIVSTSGGERVARWQGTVAGAGTWQVWARWTAAPTHTFAATYRVTTPGGTDSVAVDQRSGGGQWHLLKTLTLAANDNWQVELSDQTADEIGGRGGGRRHRNHPADQPRRHVRMGADAAGRGGLRGLCQVAGRAGPGDRCDLRDHP